MLKFINLLIALTILTSSYSYSDAPGPKESYKMDYDVISYDLEIDLTRYPSSAMSGVCTTKIYWLNNNGEDAYYFHLRDLQIDKVLFDGMEVEPEELYSPENSKHQFMVKPLTEISKDTSIIEIHYSGSMTNEGGQQAWGGVHSARTFNPNVTSTDSVLYALGVGFHCNYVSTTRHWLPCFDHPSDKAKFRGKFRVPVGHTVASIGELISISNTDNLYDEFEWATEFETATYLLTFAVDSYVKLSIGNGNPPIDIYTKESIQSKTDYIFSLVPQMVDCFENYLGKYPFEKVGYVMTPKGAMEHQTMISYPIDRVIPMANLNDTMNFVAAHELAHMWLGDMVTCQSFDEAWLNEGWASFCESLWEEYKHGKDKYWAYQGNMINAYTGTYSKQEGIFPLYDFPRDGGSSNYPVTIYYKGAAVIGMLRYKLGDSDFFKGLTMYMDRNKYGHITTDEMKTIFEEASGKDLQQFFEQWVYSKGWPKLQFVASNSIATGGMLDVQISATQVQPEDQPVFNDFAIEFIFQKSGVIVANEIVIFDSNEKTDVFSFSNLPEYDFIRVNSGFNVRTLLQMERISITSVADGSEFSTYPNPVTDYLIVDKNSNPTVLSIELIDLNGNISKDYLIEDTNDHYRINFGSAISGFYFIRLHTQYGTIDRKICINK